MALELFMGETESYNADAFYAYDDFAQLTKRPELVKNRPNRILEAFIGKGSEVEAMVDASGHCRIRMPSSVSRISSRLWMPTTTLSTLSDCV